MFCRLLKWDIINQRFILAVMSISILATVMHLILRFFDVTVISVISLIVAVIVIIVMVIVTFLYQIVYYVRAMYGNQAYINHSIACSATKMWYSKIVAGMFYSIVALALLFLLVGLIFNVNFSERNFFEAVFSSSSLFVNHISNALNISPIFISLIFIMYTFFIMFSFQVNYAFVIGLGNHKKFQKFGNWSYLIAYVIYYLVGQIATLIALFAVPLGLSISPRALSEGYQFKIVTANFLEFFMSSGGAHNFVPLSSFVMSVLLIGVYFFYTRNQLKHHINLR